MWKYYVNKYTNDRYDMILGRDLLNAMGMDLKFYDNVVIGGEGPYKGCSSPMVDVSYYNFTYITDKTVKPEESFVKLYVGKCLKSNSAISSTRRMIIILDAKYEKADLNKVITKKCQHLTSTERHILLHLLNKF